LCPVAQNSSLATYAPMIAKEKRVIPWGATAREIHNLVRGVYPFTTAVSFYGGIAYKIHESAVIEDTSRAQPGEVLVAGKRLLVACGSGTVLEISRIQAPGKRTLPAAEFLKGSSIAAGFRFDASPPCDEGGL